jgi:hypothetical protein
MAKFTGKGAQILVKTVGATPTWKPFGQVGEIGNIDVTADEVDVTTLDAGDYRDYIQGFKDPGECQITVMFDPAMADQGDTADGWLGLFGSGATRDWAIKYNSSATGGFEYGVFTGFIRDFSYGALNPDDPQQIQPTIRLSSPIDLVDTLPTTVEANQVTEPELTKMEQALEAERARLNRLREETRRRRESPQAEERELVMA